MEDGIEADGECLSDFLIALACRYELEDLRFALSQSIRIARTYLGTSPTTLCPQPVSHDPVGPGLASADASIDLNGPIEAL